MATTCSSIPSVSESTSPAERDSLMCSTRVILRLLGSVELRRSRAHGLPYGCRKKIGSSSLCGRRRDRALRFGFIAPASEGAAWQLSRLNRTRPRRPAPTAQRGRLEYPHIGRHGHRGDERHNGDDTGQGKADSVQRYLVGHVVIPL